MRKKFLFFLSVLIISGVILAACQAATETEEVPTDVTSEETVPESSEEDATTMPRDETLYFNGQAVGCSCLLESIFL